MDVVKPPSTSHSKPLDSSPENHKIWRDSSYDFCNDLTNSAVLTDDSIIDDKEVSIEFDFQYRESVILNSRRESG